MRRLAMNFCHTELPTNKQYMKTAHRGPKMKCLFKSTSRGSPNAPSFAATVKPSRVIIARPPQSVVVREFGRGSLETATAAQSPEQKVTIYQPNHMELSGVRSGGHSTEN